jgi:hypothetical protein
MSLRRCESPGNAARIAALSADAAPTAIIGCPHHRVRTLSGMPQHMERCRAAELFHLAYRKTGDVDSPWFLQSG